MRTRSQKANSGSPLQSLSQQPQPKRTRTRIAKDTAAPAPAPAPAPTPAKDAPKSKKSATRTTRTTTTTKLAAPIETVSPEKPVAVSPAKPARAPEPKAEIETPVKPSTARKARTLRRREPIVTTPRPQRSPKLDGEQLLQLIVEAKEEGIRRAQPPTPDAQPAVPAQPTTPARQSTSAQPSPAAQHATPAQQLESARRVSGQLHTPMQPAAPATPSTTRSPANPITPAAQTDTPQPVTPRTTGWGIRSLFSSFLPSVFSPAPAAEATTPATASPVTSQPTPAQPTRSAPWPSAQSPPVSASPAVAQSATPARPEHQQQDQIRLTQDQVEEIGAGLAPVPTPTRTPRRARIQSRATPRRGSVTAATTATPTSSSSKNAIVSAAMRNINDEQKHLAAAWAEMVSQKLAEDTATIGSKRRQLEQPMKLRDVKDIPARRPWEPTGSFGLLPEFFDDSDSDDEVPGWYMVDLLANEQPPLKKRKTGGDASEDTALTPVANESRHRIIDTHGNSASLNDLHPRPACVPSPMFDNPVTHHNGGNVFTEHRIQTTPVESPARPETPARDREAFLRELRRNGHVPGSGTFCFPEPDSDESDTDDEQENQQNEENKENEDTNAGLPWTQKPPPPPTPAHSKLPAQPEASPFVPGFKRVDPVQAQRAKAMKHTPAKQSRLREVMMPSPSLNSDAGSSPLVSTATPSRFASVGTATNLTFAYNNIPDVADLDFGGDAEIEAAATAYYLEHQHDADMYGGSEVILSYDEDDEPMSEDDDANL